MKLKDITRKIHSKMNHRRWMFFMVTLGVVIVMSGLVTGGVIWHEQPGFCTSCHTPMSNYVDNYFAGDTSLLITQHAKCDTLQIKCLDCHESVWSEQAREGVHWVTGNYTFPLEKRAFGTRSFCLTVGCHVEAEIIDATQHHENSLFAYNQHDPRHGKLQCYSCHSMHGQSVLSCNQCHEFDLPDGWIAPQPNGVIAGIPQ
nr:cytochrome c3 family protein [uncultured Carboxylicivirga sp.]